MKTEEGRRYRDARSDASVGSIEKSMEKTFGLPPGSVKIINPNGKKSRIDQRIENLKRKHKK